MARWILSLQPNSTFSPAEVVFNNINSLMQDLSLGANSSLIQSFGINAIASQLMSTLVPGMDFGPLVNQFSSSIINALLADIALGQNSTFAQSFTASLSALLTDIRGRYFFAVLPCFTPIDADHLMRQVNRGGAISYHFVRWRKRAIFIK